MVVNFRTYATQLLNSAQPGGSIRWLDRSGFVKRSAGATTRQNPVNPGPGRTRTGPGVFFFPFQMWFFSYTPLFHIFLVGY
jgi:hypothetical protein